ncbi:MAG: hypothetical protein EA385_04315 [Salinarimonadaceae bacterium]|nr:MAG: hypothetical protein EA385_04315 [Salinarimonadaceae bacterium]
MWAILLAIPAVALVLMVLGYYAWAKTTYPAYACGSFAKPDGEIGWVLRENASSCIGGRDVSGETEGFHAEVFTDVNGFRSARAGVETQTGGVFFVGDSWTFGFGVEYEDSFPGRFEALTDAPVAVAASPAYSALQAILLGERWVERIEPKALVYLDHGFWERAACRGSSRPTRILKPCFWQPAPDAPAETVAPPPGRVETAWRWGNLPGGVLGVGETGWDYFLISRPLAQIQQLLVRIGLASGFGHDFAAWGVDRDEMRRATLARLGGLAEKGGVPLLLLDPGEYYGDMLGELPEAQRALIHRVGAQPWSEEVSAPANLLPPDQARVPGDGHYGPGSNDLIARLIAAELTRIGALPSAP